MNDDLPSELVRTAEALAVELVQEYSADHVAMAFLIAAARLARHGLAAHQFADAMRAGIIEVETPIGVRDH